MAGLPRFDSLSDSEQAALSEGMEAFVDPTGDSSGALTNRFVERWQERIRAGIHKLERGNAWGYRLVTHVGLWVPRPDQKHGALFWKGWAPGYMEPRTSNALQSQSTLKDRMAHEICAALQGIGDRLRRCPRCKCLFVRNRKQLYCSTNCGDAARQKRHRTTTKSRDK